MKLNILLLLFFYSLSSHSANWVCGEDLNNDGILLAGDGETSSCNLVGGEQFCSVGALSCLEEVQTTVDTRYRWAVITRKVNPTITYIQKKRNLFGGWIRWHIKVPNNATEYAGYKKGAFLRSEIYWYGQGTTYIYQALKITNRNYTCLAAGNACQNIGGTQQCSPNTCIDLDTTPPEDTTAPAVSEIDNGARDATGACVDQAKMFSGRNLSCKKSGFTKNCCKDTGKVYTDSKGSSVNRIIGQRVAYETIATTYQVVGAAYTEFSALTSAGMGVELAAESASWAAESALGNFSVDPYSIAIAIAVSVVVEFISCGQQDTEAAMLNSSGYCHEVGSYCSKEWPLIGCVQRSKSYCCFNSKLARIMQQQGRPQLGIGWGSSESPNCSGFSPNQFQSLDFSQIDMSEYYEDLAGQSQSIIKQKVDDKVQQHVEQLEGGI